LYVIVEVQRHESALAARRKRLAEQLPADFNPLATPSQPTTAVKPSSATEATVQPDIKQSNDSINDDDVDTSQVNPTVLQELLGMGFTKKAAVK